MGLFNKKKKIDFIDLLIKQVEKSVEAMKALCEFIHEPNKEKGAVINKIEEEGDDLRIFLVSELNKAFITPIDREDIFALSKSIDDITDYSKSTVEEMLLFELKPDEYVHEIVETLYEATEELILALKNLKDYPVIASEHILKAKKAENFIEHRYRKGLSELFKSPDFQHIFKTREIYRHLSNAADKIDLSADILNDIIVKNL